MATTTKAEERALLPTSTPTLLTALIKHKIGVPATTAVDPPWHPIVELIELSWIKSVTVTLSEDPIDVGELEGRLGVERRWTWRTIVVLYDGAWNDTKILLLSSLTVPADTADCTADGTTEVSLSVYPTETTMASTSSVSSWWKSTSTDSLGTSPATSTPLPY